MKEPRTLMENQEISAFLKGKSSFPRDDAFNSSGKPPVADYGIERFLYEMNPHLVCLSPNLIHAAALTPGEALLALEALALHEKRPPFPIDHHLIAFLVSRWKEGNFMDLRNISHTQRETRNLATLKVLAGIQTHFKIQKLPNLCQWMADLCASPIVPHSSAKPQSLLQENIEKAASSGQLGELIRIFENHPLSPKEVEDYQEAKIEVLLIESEMKEIKSKILNQNRNTSHKSAPFEWVVQFWRQLEAAHMTQRNQKRLDKLRHRSEKLRETWGHHLLP